MTYGISYLESLMRNQQLAESCESILSELRYAPDGAQNVSTRVLVDIAAEAVLAALEALEIEAGIATNE